MVTLSITTAHSEASFQHRNSQIISILKQTLVDNLWVKINVVATCGNVITQVPLPDKSSADPVCPHSRVLCIIQNTIQQPEAGCRLMNIELSRSSIPTSKATAFAMPPPSNLPRNGKHLCAQDYQHVPL